MEARIAAAAQRADVELPDAPDAPFSEVSLNSLDLVLLISELQREFKVRIPAERISPTTMRSVRTLAALLAELGAQ